MTDVIYRKLFVGGLDFNATNSESLRKYFEQFGEVIEAVVIYDKPTGRSKGYGFVTFASADDAQNAISTPKPIIDGRKANCNLAYVGAKRGVQGSGVMPLADDHNNVNNMQWQYDFNSGRYTFPQVYYSYYPGYPFYNYPPQPYSIPSYTTTPNQPEIQTQNQILKYSEYHPNFEYKKQYKES
eukprot:gb/GECH01000273.1/.p1 GENE.gb/GECH01000273.1/~~gb/GECH01000273.1/.p1  ORF type:complete len:183 (+),score=32.01 gb/GECH01000273.1/:1-549(+)